MSVNDHYLTNPPVNPTRRERFVRFLTHLICLGMLFILPEILNSMGKPFRSVPELKLGVYAKALVFIAVFYINYCFIIGRSFERKRFAWRLVGYNVVVIAGALLLFKLISVWMQPYWDEAWRIRQAAKGIVVEASRPKPQPQGIVHWLNMYARDFAMLVLTIGLSIALKLSDSWVKLSRRSEQLVAARRHEELNNLKSQLNPHFLFNTLNSIYALIAVSPAKAQDAVHELSGMLRYVLYDDRREVELHRELSFIRNYVKLMALRLPPSTRLSCDLDAGTKGNATVPPLLFIPLIENAFKHGNTGQPDTCISLSVRVEEERVICQTINNLQQASDKSASPDINNGSGGIGLQNLRRRLQLIYGDDASLTTSKTDGIFRATLSLPLQKMLPKS